MIRLLHGVWLALLLPLSAMAQPVQVTSGEHDGFTRLVFDYGQAADWQVGRTTDGYELRLNGASPAYDLTGVFDPIGRNRLASVWVDPATGALRIGIGCACHAQPFEFRPGIVVIDLKDGPPPAASAFELALDGAAMPALSPRPVPRPRPRPGQVAGPKPAGGASVAYDWTALLREPTADVQPEPPPLPATDPDLQPLREALLQQLSRGVAKGVVEMADPAPRTSTVPEPDSVQIHLGEVPGLRIDATGGPGAALTAEGAACVADEALDLASWGTESPVSEQMAEAMSGLMGEFDTPDPAAAQRAVRFLLFIGFGAEARQILAQLDGGLPDTAVLSSLAHILDGSGDPEPAFAGMAACDTAAALWAVLGSPPPPPGAAFDRAAVLRTFSALPLQLRRWLGPALAERLLALDDPSAAQSVRDAILRAPGDAGPGVALMEARLDLASGDPAAAEARLDPLIAESGPATADALLAQIETHLARKTSPEPGVITTLESLLHERRDTPDAARFALALTQARALSGDFDAAFADLETVPEAAQDVWRLLAETGPDSALLTHAIRPDGRAPTVAAPVAAQIAERLSTLGFAGQAGEWLRQVPVADVPLAAQIALQSGDGRGALRLLAGSENPEVEPLRQQALRLLADDAALAERLASTGEDEARWRAIGRARDWPQLASAGPQPWQTLAAAAVGSGATEPAEGPLARGQALIESSQQTRAQVADLLSQIAPPQPAVP